MSEPADRVDTQTKLIEVIGLGLNGVAGLDRASLRLIESAPLVVGGPRHLDVLADLAGETLAWRQPLSATLEDIAQAMDRGVRPIVVLATGDPLDHGVARLLIARFGVDAVRVRPQPSAFALAGAALGWAREDYRCLSLHGRPLGRLIRELTPGRKLLCLTDAESSAGNIATLLDECGWGASRMWRLSRLGGADEAIRSATAQAWRDDTATGLDVVAILVSTTSSGAVEAGFPPDSAFDHDGQLSKAPARGQAMAALNPLPGQHLWDLGAGCGGTAITWLRLAGSGRVSAIERDPCRAERLAFNAERLGAPELEVHVGEALSLIGDLDAPDTIFVGGGCSDEALLERSYERLQAKGRMVAQAVSAEGQIALQRFASDHDGRLERFHHERLKPLGGLHVWQPALPLVQLTVIRT